MRIADRSHPNMSSQRLTVPLLVIAGPTAVGKTDIAVSVAGEVGGEIVSADSMQIYKGMDIGTAKPTAEQQSQVRFHLIDVVEPDESYNVSMFQRDAQHAIKEIYQRGHLPILCGGTGLYIRAVLEHYNFPPAPEDKQLRQHLRRQAEKVGSGQMHQQLEQVDPETAQRLAPSDTKRIIRALEVYELTGQPISALQSVDGRPQLEYNTAGFVVCCPRAVLYRRIEERIQQMLSAGWLEEVRRLAQVGYHSGLQSMQAIGYRHLLAYLAGNADWSTSVQLIKRDSRRFAKRQLTWFRHQTDFTWLMWANQQQFDRVVQTIIEADRTLAAATNSAQ